MSVTDSIPPRYEEAVKYGMRGVRLLPVEHHSRSAILPQWERNAANDVEFVDRHFASGHNNIGLCCGPQPNGWNLLAVDVDDQRAWDALEAEYGPLDRTSVCFHRTPTGGLHLFFDVPPGMAITRQNVPVKGIDLRGGQEGNVGCGYVLLTKSEAPSKTTGELLPYRAREGRGLLDRDPGPAPEWLLRLIEADLNPPKKSESSMERHPSSQPSDGDDPWSWVRDNLSWETYLIKHEWQRKGRYWVRPGKTTRQEHAAQLHDDGRFAFWSQTDMPAGMTALGSRQVDGGYSISLADFICAYEDGGDRQAFGRRVRRELMPPSAPPLARVKVLTDGGSDSSAINDLCLPEWFWIQRPWLMHLRDAAWAVGAVPESLLAASLGRIATMIPPNWAIPAIIHDEATFDLMTVIVGHSGTGKSAPMRRAARLLPCVYPRLRFNLGLGSGEGVLEAYYGMIDDPDADPAKGKKIKGRAFDGVHFTVDEGAVMTDLSDRKGWTGINYMLTAWSGGTLSTANATQERFRHVEAGTYRFALTMAIQADLAKGLWSDNNVAQGFTGRLTLFSGLSTTVPAPSERPADPGSLSLHLPTQGYPMTLTYPAGFVLEVQQHDHARKTLIDDPDPLGAHRNLQRTKLAGIMALMDGRWDVDIDDVALATVIVETSEAIRQWLQDRARSTANAAHDRAVRQQGIDLADRESAQIDRAIARVARRLLKLVTDATANGVLRSDLRNKTPYRDRESYFDAALDSLLEAGLVIEVDGWVRLS